MAVGGQFQESANVPCVERINSVPRTDAATVYLTNFYVFSDACSVNCLERLMSSQLRFVITKVLM